MRLTGWREFTWTEIRHKQKRRLWRLGTAGLLSMILLALGAFLSGVAQAGHNFSDVPTGVFYHNAVEWVFNRGITVGCAMGMYCPNDAVTRGTMAVFLQREGQALTPAFLFRQLCCFPADPGTNPVVCDTSDFLVTGYPRTALVDGQISIDPGANGVSTNNVYSVNGGTSWVAVNSRSLGGSGGPFTASSHGRLDLTVGTTYRFGIIISRIFGTGNVALDCEMYVTIVNRNGTSSPLSPSR